jgi:hypothetical protein
VVTERRIADAQRSAAADLRKNEGREIYSNVIKSDNSKTCFKYLPTAADLRRGWGKRGLNNSIK